MVPGSWAVDVVGSGTALMAAVLGWLALKQAKEATKWAEESAKLQRWATALDEAALPVRFNAMMAHEVYHDGDKPGQPFGRMDRD